MRLFDSIGFRFFRLRTGHPSRPFGSGSAGIFAMIATVFALCAYMLPFFSAFGDSICPPPPVDLPTAEHCRELNLAPGVFIHKGRILIEGLRPRSDEEIKTVLGNLIKNLGRLHPGVDVPELIISADRTTPFSLIRRVMTQASAAGFPGFQLEVVREFRL